MSRILMICAALLLCACASPVPIKAASHTNAIGAATLAPWGSFEFQLAPSYTHNAILRQQAAAALVSHRIDSGQARRILSLTDAARAALDRARKTDSVDYLSIATAAQDAADRILKGK